MSDLLKSAIADAKAVRATALANAKAALEEAFAPQLQSMLATKLQQEVEGEETEELGDPTAAPLDVPVTDQVPVAPQFDAAAQPDGATLDGGADEAPAFAPEAPVTDEVPVGDEVGEAEIPTDEPATDPTMGEAGVGVQGHIDPTELPISEDKASTDYKKTTKGHKTEDPQGAKVTKKKIENTTGALTAKGGTTKASSDYTKTTSGHKSEDPQGASHEFSKGPGKADKNATGKTLEEGDMEVDESSLDEILKELEAEVAMENCGAETVGAGAPQGEDPAVQQAPVDEEIDLSSLLEPDDDDADDKKEVEEGKLPPWLKKGGKKDDDKKEEEDEDEDEDEDDKEVVKENISLKKELAEYRNAVTYLRDRINEVTLLNAKLLYTNRLFKQATLTNEQKLKVIESFDLTKSVREAKLIYATLSESFNFGGKKTVTAPAPVAKKTGLVKTITEGLASKPVASTKPTKTVITEGAEMANRFKKLAGIRSK